MVNIRNIMPAVLLLCSSLAQVYGNCESDMYFRRDDIGSKRALLGGDLQAAEHELRMILVRLAEEEGPFYRVAQIFDASEQLMAGSLRTLHAELIDFNGVNHGCEVHIWTRPWFAEGAEITLRCECLKTVVRHFAEPIKF